MTDQPSQPAAADDDGRWEAILLSVCPSCPHFLSDHQVGIGCLIAVNGRGDVFCACENSPEREDGLRTTQEVSDA